MNHLVLFADYEELGPFAAAVVLAVYGLVILAALLFKAFRSLTRVMAVGVMSGLASLPAASAFFEVWRYPGILRRQTVPMMLTMVVVLLCFVWFAPFIQYFVLRDKAKRGNQPGG